MRIMTFWQIYTVFSFLLEKCILMYNKMPSRTAVSLPIISPASNKQVQVANNFLYCKLKAIFYLFYGNRIMIMWIQETVNVQDHKCLEKFNKSCTTSTDSWDLVKCVRHDVNMRCYVCDHQIMTRCSSWVRRSCSCVWEKPETPYSSQNTYRKMSSFTKWEMVNIHFAHFYLVPV